MKIAEAKRQLEAANYYVEYTPGNANVYVRTHPTFFPTTMRAKGGEVSDRSVAVLLNRMGVKP